MARPARKAKSQSASKLAEALNFVAPASSDGTAAPYQAHARLAGNWIVASDGAISAGHPIEEELALCPHIGRLIDALNKAGSTLAITERDNGTLMITGDKLRAVIPCIPGEEFPAFMPDPRVAAIDERIKEGFTKLLPLAKEDAERIVEISILLRANSMFSCNGQVIFEYWHGIDLPPGMAIPKAFVAAVAKQSKKLEGFGFSDKSVTFYFEQGAWIRTQLYRNEWPDIDALFNVPAYPVPTPEGLFEAVAAIQNFSEDGGVHFHDDKLKSSYDNYREDGPVYGATFDVPGLQSGHSFTAKLLRLIEPVCEQFDYTSNEDRALFVGGNVRGVIMKRSKPAPPLPPVEWTPQPVQEAPSAPEAGWGAPAVPGDPNAAAWATAAADASYPKTGFYSPFDPDLEDDVPF
jgi:hypothetical protein